jgi:hypothetical protein
MKWRKLGKIFDIEEMLSHSSTPSPLVIGENQVRVFYSSRDIHNRSSVSYFDFDVSTLKVLYAHDKPLVRFGNKHSFYSAGISLGNVFKWKHDRYLAFMGWKLPVVGHWFGQIGLLHVDKENNLQILNDTPVLPLNLNDPISLSYPWVSDSKSSEISFWYGSTVTWDGPNSDMIHILKTGKATSLLNWKSGDIALSFDERDFQAFSSPTILAIGEKKFLFYSYRGKSNNYRIGSAELMGKRPMATKNDFGISKTLEEWESQMQCYPRIFSLSGYHYMLYNGNQFGKTGIGLAKLEI